MEPRDAYEDLLERTFGMIQSGKSSSGFGNIGNAGAAKASVAVTPEPVLMRASKRLHYSKFNTTFLPAESIMAMARNQVVPGGKTSPGRAPKVIPEHMLDWCEENCAGLWMPSPPSAPEYIMFEDNADLTLFITAFGGGSN
jgi:hypothetical protein